MGTNALDVIKKALLLEYRGKTFYENAAKTTNSDAVKEIFNTMVEEEEKHAEMLTHMFNDISKGKVTALDLDSKPADISLEIISEKIKKDVSAAGFEAAAISAAIAMETGAVKFYTESAKNAETDEEKKLYNWLASWEQTHAKYLSEIDREIMESVWEDNKFWPLY